VSRYEPLNFVSLMHCLDEVARDFSRDPTSVSQSHGG
jgi:hypothetical protein